MFTICLDAGHSINTPGKRIPGDIEREWSINNKVCRYIAEYLRQYEVMIHRLDDVTGAKDISLKNRLDKATKLKPDLCLSIHQNAAGSGRDFTNATGVSIFINKSSSNQTRNFANYMLNKLSYYTGLRNRGIGTNGLYMTSLKSFPTFLVEGGFMDGIADSKIIVTKEYQQAYAKAIVDGIVETYSLKEKKETLSYDVHIQNWGWASGIRSGEIAGTTGKSLRLEAIQINSNKKINYKAHVQNIGWQDWKTNGQIAGTTGQGLRLEAIQITCEVPMSYRVHIQNIGWQDWKNNGEVAGTTGQGLRVEAIQIKLI